MARGEKEYGAKGMRWVDSKMKDGKGGAVKVRTNKPAEPTVKPKARPAAPAKAKAKPAPAKPKMSATAKATGKAGAGNKSVPKVVRGLEGKIDTLDMEKKNIAALKSIFKGTGKDPAKAPNRAEVFKKKKKQ